MHGKEGHTGRLGGRNRVGFVGTPHTAEPILRSKISSDAGFTTPATHYATQRCTARMVTRIILGAELGEIGIPWMDPPGGSSGAIPRGIPRGGSHRGTPRGDPLGGSLRGFLQGGIETFVISNLFHLYKVLTVICSLVLLHRPGVQYSRLGTLPA